MNNMTRAETAEAIINTLENAVRGRQVLVLGSPRSGKTYFLSQLAEQISNRQRSWVTYLSGSATKLMSLEFFNGLVDTLKKEGCLDPAFELVNKPASLTSFFERIKPVLYKEMIRHLVILVDDLDQNKMAFEDIALLLSSVRGFYTEWREIDINIHFVFTGQINSCKLLTYYREPDNASWPFLQGKTIYHLLPLTAEEIFGSIDKATVDSKKLVELYTQYLFELSNGDLYTVFEILKSLGKKKISCLSLFEAAEKLTTSLEWIETLSLIIKGLSTKASNVLTVNLQGNFVSFSDLELEEELLLSGLFSKTKNQTISVLNSVMERSLRKNWNRIKPKGAPDVFSDLAELIPPVFALNKTAYELLAEIEMRLRNIVVLRLGAQKGDRHLLSNINIEINPRTDLKEDQYFRSIDWRKRVGKSQYVDAHAALISYTNTRDLLGLVDHLISKNDEVIVPLKVIRPRLEGMKEIRDAVMHGQVITEKSVENLFDIYYELIQELTIRY